ncbi:MAG TPA: peptidoglycan DD-metalloendopeptidase family protein [Cellvibrionaceae bacterium]
MKLLLIRAGVIACCFLGGVQIAHAAEPANPETKLTELKNTIEQLKKELISVKSNRESLHGELEASEKKITELNKKIEELKQQLQTQQSSLNQLRGEREGLASAKKQQEAQVAQHLNAAYRLGNQSAIKLLLNQENPADLSRNLKYFEYLIAARNKQINQFAGTIKRLNELEPAITAQSDQLEENKKDVEAQRLAMNELVEERKRTLAKLNATIDDKDQVLKAYEQDRRALQDVMTRISLAEEKAKQKAKAANAAKSELTAADSIEQKTSPSEVAPKTTPGSKKPNSQITVASTESAPLRGNLLQLKGELPWPATGRLVNDFGSSRVAGKVNWEGIYIQGTMGAPVKAIARGKVVFADYLKGHGLLIIIDHGQGYLSLYAHNQSLSKKLGEPVEAGSVIASLGNTGGQADAGLYFELRHNGQPTNPKPWLKKSA